MEFWALTPREIHACIDVWQDGEIMENIRCGTIAASAYNTHRTKKDDKVWTWKDFFRDPRPCKVETAETIGRSLDMMYSIVKARRGGI